ncbi:MAG: transporter substrate-binding domain-containing protein [Candidatus Limnocylindrales bacterium]|nr:transporter substrate-binding domain-containing protein [Candidatus Limnocylindrales bacterium]
MTKRGRAASLLAAALLVSACTSGGVSPSAAPPSEAPATPAAATPAPAPATPIPGGLLDIVVKAGEIRVSTDPQYPPQSELKPDGSYEGFDIDVATEIAKRMGLGVKFETPTWDTITAGSWGGRWDMSVGSMTITSPRQKVVDFSPAYYYTPAQMAASTASGITTLDGLAGKAVCVGEATTYLDWLNGTLDFGTESPQTKPPTGTTATTLGTDRLCAEAWKAGRDEFQGWLSSSTTVDQAINDGLPLVKVGDPVYSEPLAVAVDKSGPDPTDFMAKIDEIVTAMHADGTLTKLSQKWFGTDLTQKLGG